MSKIPPPVLSPKAAPLERWAGDFTGCQDNSCIVRRPRTPGGKPAVGTNGGCRCRPEVLKIVAMRIRMEVLKLEKVVVQNMGKADMVAGAGTLGEDV